MIKKLKNIPLDMNGKPSAVWTKINELVDVVNKLETMAKNTNTVLESLIQENNFHEMQIDELQMKLEPEKCDIPDSDDAIQEVIHADPYAEQRQWIGKLCRCWDSDINNDTWGILQDIKDNKTEKYYLYGIGYEHCEPVKPDDDIIYKGGDNELHEMSVL